ncbi:GNAT family N-acetyltransferase [Schaalia hyovaginalis]|uniref:GNAT family N-acetyltransferase n=1 Tax=Schaalia hyovaginalis TaxID=29316 RepID=UPI002A74B445|nr:GNAT family N-acetyltransferase [Schaalia hyovaginalis]MDY2667931.1 GNAT family N-acetyltransferase [Schaalia hyovaginalis]
MGFESLSATGGTPLGSGGGLRAADRIGAGDVDATGEAHGATVVAATIRGDLGVVAEEGGRPIGVAWALYLPTDDSGYGFVDEATPEISLWVAVDFRGRGISRELLRSALVALAEAGAQRVALSCEAGNGRALALYRSEGFVAVLGREKDGVMLKDLASARRSADSEVAGDP